MSLQLFKHGTSPLPSSMRIPLRIATIIGLTYVASSHNWGGKYYSQSAPSFCVNSRGALRGSAGTRGKLSYG